MATVQVRDAKGQVVRDRELPAEVFGTEVNVPVMHQVVVAAAAARRAGTHSTKTRGEVSGGGRKPWRQKGTGRARQGSTRAPQWMGGGVAHGPKPGSHDVRVNKKVRRLALRSALSDAARSGKLAVVDGLAFDGPKTKDAVAVLDALGTRGRILLVLPGPDDATERSFRNLDHVKVDYTGSLGTYDVLYADTVLFTSEALDALTGEHVAGSQGRREAERLQPVSEAGPDAASEPAFQDTPTTSEAPSEEQGP